MSKVKDYDMETCLLLLSIMWDGGGVGPPIAEGVGPTQRDAGRLVSKHIEL